MEDYNLTKKRRVLIVFDDMTENMEFNKKLSPIVTELNCFLIVFTSQSYFKVPKTKTKCNTLFYNENS